MRGYDERCSERTEVLCPHVNWNSNTSGWYDEVTVWCGDCGETIGVMTKAEFEKWLSAREDQREANEAMAQADLIAEVDLEFFGPQEPPQDPRIFNRRQADGTFRPLAEFFDREVGG